MGSEISRRCFGEILRVEDAVKGEGTTVNLQRIILVLHTDLPEGVRVLASGERGPAPQSGGQGSLRVGREVFLVMG